MAGIHERLFSKTIDQEKGGNGNKNIKNIIPIGISKKHDLPTRQSDNLKDLSDAEKREFKERELLTHVINARNTLKRIVERTTEDDSNLLNNVGRTTVENIRETVSKKITDKYRDTFSFESNAELLHIASTIENKVTSSLNTSRKTA